MERDVGEEEELVLGLAMGHGQGRLLPGDDRAGGRGSRGKEVGVGAGIRRRAPGLLHHRCTLASSNPMLEAHHSSPSISHHGIRQISSTNGPCQSNMLPRTDGRRLIPSLAGMQILMGDERVLPS
uniref:Uncharacterized protein n=1 Tax=Setaria viridis TaxID=4556 RepID=A0A4U6VM46_SETVI|nr:hypothetical protein SEVIR_3G120300v2 [Setaria viridis]